MLLGAGGFIYSAVRVYNATSEPQRAFECLAAAISVASGLFITQSKWAVSAFKAAFLMTVLQCLMFAAKLNGDLELPPKTWPTGSFFFVVSWGIDRYITHVLKRNLQIVAEFEDLMRSSGEIVSGASAPVDSSGGCDGKAQEGVRRRGGAKEKGSKEKVKSAKKTEENKKKQ